MPKQYPNNYVNYEKGVFVIESADFSSCTEISILMASKHPKLFAKVLNRLVAKIVTDTLKTRRIEA